MSADIIMLHLLQIYHATIHMGVYVEQWKEIEMCMLHKHGKPRYDLPKVYWLVTLVNTIAKLLS